MLIKSLWYEFFKSIGLSEKLSEVAGRDLVYFSMKQVTPRRRARPAKETLIAIEPAQSENNQRFSLQVDRRTKRGRHFGNGLEENGRKGVGWTASPVDKRIEAFRR